MAGQIGLTEEEVLIALSVEYRDLSKKAKERAGGDPLIAFGELPVNVLEAVAKVISKNNEKTAQDTQELLRSYPESD